MPPKKIKSRKARKTNVKDLPLASLNLAEQPEHDIEINETKYAIESVYDPKSDYSHYVLNFVISNCVANNPQIRFIEIGRELQYLRGNLQAFKNNLQQTIVIIPIRPMGDNGQERQHFAGLYIGRNGAQFSAFYIDPIGYGVITDIPQNIRDIISQIFDVPLVISTVRNKIQHSELKGKIRIISNHHCGPFIADILSALALGNMRVENRKLQVVKEGEWQDIPDLDKSSSNNWGRELRTHHLQLFKEIGKEQKSTIEIDGFFFPRCEYYSRFKGTTFFDMNDSKYWRTYFRSTTRGGDCDRYAKEFKDSLKTFGNSKINVTSNKEHAKSGAFVSPFFHEEYKKIINTQTVESKKRKSADFLYDRILKYKQKLCDLLKDEIDKCHFNKVVAIYDNKYPCIMISIKGISSKDGKNNIDSWYKMIMSYYVAIVNYLSMTKGMAIELVLRSSFGHNIPSVDSTEESFRINIGIIPEIYLGILLEGLKRLDRGVIQKLEKSTISGVSLSHFNTRIKKYNTREGLKGVSKLPEWTESLFETLNLQAVRGQNKKHVNVIHEIVARGRNYPDLLIDLIIEELIKYDKPNYAKPLISMLEMLDYSHKSITLNTSVAYSYNNQEKKLNFPEMDKVIMDNVINDSEFWNLLAQISHSLYNLGLERQINSKQLEGIYSALEKANLEFIRNSGYQEADDGVGSDSDCEAEWTQPKKIKVYARKIITVTGMRAINLAAFLAFHDISSASVDEYGVDTRDMYHETGKAVNNISDVMATWFDKVKNNRSSTVNKVIFFDLNKCVVQPDDYKTSLEMHLKETSKDFLVILDYTSAITDEIQAAILTCLQKVKTVLLVNSGLKNEQAGSDMNPYGTLRIVSTDPDKMLSLYYFAKDVLLQENVKDYLPKVAHQIRKAYKDSGFVVTSKDIFKQHYSVGEKISREASEYCSDWDFIQSSEEISLLLRNELFDIEQIKELHTNSREIFLRLVDIIPRLLEEEIIENKTLLSLFNGQDNSNLEWLSDLLNFSEWLLDNVEDNGLLDLSPKNIARLISIYSTYKERLDNLINEHHISLIEASSWSDDEIKKIGGRKVKHILEKECEELDVPEAREIKGYYSQNKAATLKVIDYFYSAENCSSTFNDLLNEYVNGETNNSAEECENRKEDIRIKNGCPNEDLPKDLHGSDCIDDSYQDSGDEVYVNNSVEECENRKENKIIKDGCPNEFLPKGYNGSESDSDCIDYKDQDSDNEVCEEDSYEDSSGVYSV